MNLQERNDFIYDIMCNIYSRIKVVEDLNRIYDIQMDDENYRKLSNSCATYFEVWKDKDQRYESFLNSLKIKKFEIPAFRSIQQNPDGTFIFTNKFEQFVAQHLL